MAGKRASSFCGSPEHQLNRRAFLGTLAEIHFRLKNKKEALRLIDRAIALDPERDLYRAQRQTYRAGG